LARLAKGPLLRGGPTPKQGRGDALPDHLGAVVPPVAYDAADVVRICIDHRLPLGRVEYALNTTKVRRSEMDPLSQYILRERTEMEGYQIELTETYRHTAFVEAESAAEAFEKVRKAIDDRTINNRVDIVIKERGSDGYRNAR
jgi:hypothetical protein